MKARPCLMTMLVLTALLLPACQRRTPPDKDVLYLNLVWHQHQPLYYKDAEGNYTRPWVRVHATKDYYDMAALVAQYPSVHVTFNLTPVLIRQLDDFAENGAKDVYWVLAEKPAGDLTAAEKQFVLERFFDANWTNVIGRFPRYRALLDQRGGATPEEIQAALESFDEQDLRDLQVWFNLAWFDPMFLEQEPLRALVEKGEGFSEQDKQVVFDEARRIVQEVIPLHRQLQDDGQIEIITSPYAHPILPLLYNTRLALEGNPNAELPERFSYPNDAIAQLERSVAAYDQHFGQPPRGLWPSEGAVAEEIVPLVSDQGFDWMASGEQVLAESLGLGAFTRDADDTVREADDLYRPYFVQAGDSEPVAIVFRDLRLSDLIGFEYSQTPGEQAAQDFLSRLGNIRQELKREGAEGPHLVTVILDGENAWEYYPNDGKAFLIALYQGLSESETIQTVTPSEYLEMFPDQRPLEDLFPGAWFSPNFDTWIGEAEETTAWDYLRETREDLAPYDITQNKTAPSAEALAQALDFMYLAEGSDWMWWYGADQSSGNDEYFDQGFRALLEQVYLSLGLAVPSFVRVPIIPVAPVEPEQELRATFTATIDGRIDPAEEWSNAATYSSAGGVQARAEDVVEALLIGVDKENLYLRIDLETDFTASGAERASFYIGSPHLEGSLPFRRENPQELIGFAASTLIEVNLRGPQPLPSAYRASPAGWSPEAGADVSASFQGQVLELAFPLNQLGELEVGDDLRLAAVVSAAGRTLQSIPTTGPARLIFPDLGLTIPVLRIEDPQGDDHGPGSYTYPTDSVFEPQVFDLKYFAVGFDEKNIVFTFDFYGPVPNPWGSPNNLALQTLDVYIDTDPGAGTGSRLLLPGRNAALTEGAGWEYAVWAEGWTPQFVAPDETGAPKMVGGTAFKVIVDRAANRVQLRVPRAAFGGGDPMEWAYAAAVLSQDGFPATGVWRVRDVLPRAEQWRIGGAPDDVNHTRIIDYAWAAAGGRTQEEMLSTYPESTGPLDGLTANDYPQVDMLTP